jgi:hypothetical protein
VYHRKDTGDNKPIRQPSRRISLTKEAEVKEMLDDMQRHGVIEESESPWSSFVLLVGKKNGEFRRLQKTERRNKQRLLSTTPNQCTLDMLAEAKWFSTLDLKIGYWQVDVNADDKEKTAFSTGQGLWQFIIKPFGF